MLKISKQFILFLMLMMELFKKLTSGLAVFVYKRIASSRWEILMCFSAIAFGVYVSMMLFNAVPQSVAADNKAVKNTAPQELPEFNIDKELSEIEQTKNLLAQASVTDDQEINDTGAISYQATMFSESESIGRSEPFSPSYGMGTSAGGPNTTSVGPMDLGGDMSGLSPEEIAKREAEQRRQEIVNTLNRDFNVKGIVLDMGENVDPMVIAEVLDTTGVPSVKTLSLGETIHMAVCEATVKEIYPNRVVLESEDVRVERHLPGFDDDSIDTAGNIPPGFGGGMSSLSSPPAPTPGGNSQGGSSMNDAKQKIEEIDKLLDSF